MDILFLMHYEWYQTSLTTGISPTMAGVFTPEFQNICIVWSIFWFFSEVLGYISHVLSIDYRLLTGL